MIDKEDAIRAATVEIKRKYPEAQFQRTSHSQRLEEFPGKSGWEIWFRVYDNIDGEYDRAVEVEESTGAVRIVMLL